MSAAIRIDCDGEGCRLAWNAAPEGERHLATAHFTTAEDVDVDFDGLGASEFYVDAWATLPEGWAIQVDARGDKRFICSACSGGGGA